MRRVAALIAAATPAVEATDAALRGLVLEALREAMENPWKTHRKPMVYMFFFIATNTGFHLQIAGMFPWGVYWERTFHHPAIRSPDK